MSEVMSRSAVAAADRKMAQLLGGARYDGKVVPLPAIVIPQLAPDAIHLGAATDTKGPIGFDLAKLLDGRLLVQGASGAGKSWTLRRILEETHGRIQQIIVDPEGEFRSLAETFGHVYVEAHRLDAAAVAVLAARTREHRISILLDLSEMDRTAQMQAVAAFFSALIEAPREHWHPCLVVVDEAHLFAPFGGQGSEPPSVRKASIGAVSDLMSRGRKRGLCGVLATQRLARLAKSVVSEAFNFLIGLNTLDLDIRRAAETIGWDARKAFDRLPVLQPGEFVATGPAFSRAAVVLKVGAIQTQHRGARPEITVPEALGSEQAASLLELGALMEAASQDEEQREKMRMPEGRKAVRALIRDPAFSDAGRVWAALLPLVPEGARVSQLAQHLELDRAASAATLALLDTYGALEFSGSGQNRAVRIAKDMLP